MPKTITLTDAVTGNVQSMLARLATIGLRYGEESPEYAVAGASLARAFGHLLTSGFGDAHVVPDGKLGLFVNEAGFAYGIIFHGNPGAARRKIDGYDLDETTVTHAMEHYNVAGLWTTHS